MGGVDRSRVLKLVGAALAIGVAATVGYGVGVEPRFVLDERRVTAALPRLDPSWEGERIAVFSDLQVGMWLANTAMIERVVERVVELDPAAVLLVGDFVYSESPDVRVQVDEVLRLLRPISDAGIPALAVLGNHDYAVGAADELARALPAAGIEVLRNDSAVLPAPEGVSGEPLHVVGLGPSKPPLADPVEALADVPEDAARITMMHNPTAFPLLPPRSAPFTVAGHTHCGQIALPGTPRWSYLALTDEEKLVADGFAPAEYGAEGNAMFVTCGIGFSLIPMRINAPPQLVLINLTAFS